MNSKSDLFFNSEARLLDSHNDIFEILNSLITIFSKNVNNNSDNDLNLNFYISDDNSDYDLNDNSDYLSNIEIKLIHFSIKNYLVSERFQYNKIKIFNIIYIAANNFIAKNCFLYIFYYDKSNFKIIFPNDLEYFPFLRCACEF
jgi:hypothetical protein